MLERLNGNEKGDAIVSVRGYEPIWTVFTPSYELKNVYFKEGKAAIGKREAVLFEKENYVFDIHGGNKESEMEKILDAIERMEEEEGEQTIKKQEQLEALDEEWQSIVDDINVRLVKFAEMLKGKDSKAVLQASIGTKATILYEIMENYDKARARKIQQMADYISSCLPKLKKLQDEAKK